MSKIDLPEDVRSFIERVTLHLQANRSKIPEQHDAFFQEAYRLYSFYNVEVRHTRPDPVDAHPAFADEPAMGAMMDNSFCNCPDHAQSEGVDDPRYCGNCGGLFRDAKPAATVEDEVCVACGRLEASIPHHGSFLCKSCRSTCVPMPAATVEEWPDVGWNKEMMEAIQRRIERLERQVAEMEKR